MKRFVWMLPLLALLYLIAWPAPIDPVAWQPPSAPSLDQGLYARADGLQGVQRLLDGGVKGPEAVAFDGQGRLYTGLVDGRVVSLRADGSDCREVARTEGRPLGLQVQSDGSVVVADALKGLLRIEADGRIQVLARDAEGIGFGFADDVAIDARGRMLLSDASWKFGYGQHQLDALEHGARGRLVMHDPDKRLSVTLLAERQFANGVTLGPDEAYVLLNETTEYKITRYWLKGEKAGTVDTFAENLPGFPDNLSFNGTDRFWVALYGPRDALLDALAPMPFLRSVVSRLPQVLMPEAARQGFILGLDLDGKVVEQYRDSGPGAYGPITSVRERDGFLYLGSLSDTAIGRVSLADLRSGRTSTAPTPQAGTCAPRR